MKRISLYIIASLLVFSCGKEEAKTEEKFEISANKNEITLNDAQIKTAGIETSSLNNQTLANKLILNGMIDVPPTALATVSAPSGGYIRAMRLVPGQFVSRGQTLAVLEDPQIVQLQQDYLLAKSNLSYAQKDYARQKDLNQSKASSDKVMQQAQTESQNQNIMMRGMAEKLRTLGINPESLNAGNIRRTVAVPSPISGKIASVNVNIGQYVSPTEKMVEIANTGNIQLALKVFEKDLNKIAVGQRVFAYTNDNPGKRYNARVTMIDRDFGADRSVTAYCTIDGADASLVRGLYMNAELEVDEQEGFAIPDDAVVTFEGKQYLFQAKTNKTFVMTPVTIGLSENGYTQILNYHPADLDKKWVTKGAYHLLMGLKNVEE